MIANPAVMYAPLRKGKKLPTIANTNKTKKVKHISLKKNPKTRNCLDSEFVRTHKKTQSIKTEFETYEIPVFMLTVKIRQKHFNMDWVKQSEELSDQESDLKDLVEDLECQDDERNKQRIHDNVETMLWEIENKQSEIEAQAKAEKAKTISDEAKNIELYNQYVQEMDCREARAQRKLKENFAKREARRLKRMARKKYAKEPSVDLQDLYDQTQSLCAVCKAFYAKHNSK